MSIEEHSIPVVPCQASCDERNVVAPLAGARFHSSVDTLQSDQKRWYRPLLSPLWLCLLVALIIRVWLIVHTHGIIDGDEALVGIQAERILHGDFPVYFYGIPYFGSLEAYLISILFAIFGPSVWAIRAESTILSLVLVWLTWRLASELADVAQLPAYAKRCFTIVAGLVAAVPPLYDGIVELRTWGGYIETFVLMMLLLLSALRLTRRWHEGASNRELALRWAGIGFIVGLGMWVYPLIVSAILAAALWIICDRIAAIIQLRRELTAVLAHPASDAGQLRGRQALHAQGGRKAIPQPTLTAILRSTKPLLLAVAAIPAAIVGCTPAILWGATHHWENVSYIQELGGTWSRQRLHLVHQVTNIYATCVAPRIISGAVPGENKTLAAIHSPVFIFSLFCIFATASIVGISLIWAVVGRQRASKGYPQHCHAERSEASHAEAALRYPLNPSAVGYSILRLAGLPTLFATCAAVIFCTSTASRFELIGCNLDLAGRYATPLLLALPFFFATMLTLASMLIYEKSKNRSQNAEDASNPTRSQPYRFVARLRIPLVIQVLLFLVLLSYLGAQARTYGLSDADHTFQSPYCPIAPANNDPIIAYLQHEHIRYAWATNLLAHPIIFKTNSNIIVVDPLALTRPPIAIDRIPSYTEAVKNADRPSFLVFVQHGNPHPRLLRLLDAEQVTYRAAFFPSEPGIDVLVVTPLSRTVSPLESQNIDVFFCFTQ